EPYFYIEERESLNFTKIAIDNNFNLNLSEIDLISLKSKGKTILDFYIVIENAEGEIVRKEKIKYEHANYKKDNYYSHWYKEDQENNKHHFLITTTPFNNLKIETFVINKDIEI